MCALRRQYALKRIFAFSLESKTLYGKQHLLILPDEKDENKKLQRSKAR
jgi:hypothetical protein